jgi:hypothetical protein
MKLENLWGYSRDLKFWGLMIFIFVVTIAGTAAYIALTAPYSI